MPETFREIAKRAKQVIKEINFGALYFIQWILLLFSNLNEWMNEPMNSVSDERENDERHSIHHRCIYKLFCLFRLPIIMSGICYSWFACCSTICSLKNIGGHRCLISVAYSVFRQRKSHLNFKKIVTPFSYFIFLPKITSDIFLSLKMKTTNHIEAGAFENRIYSILVYVFVNTKSFWITFVSSKYHHIIKIIIHLMSENVQQNILKNGTG